MQTIFRITLLSGNSYLVVSKNCKLAYDQLRNYLDNNDIEFSAKRDLAKVEVIANSVSDDTTIIFEEI